MEIECEHDIVKKIWCSVCRLYGKDKTAAFSIGTSNLKKETVKKHFQSGQHADTLKIKIARQCIEANSDTKILKGLKQMEKGTEEKMIKIFRTAFHVAFYEKPFTEFPRLLELQECNGLLVGDSYKNDKQCKLFIEYIAGIYHNDLKNLLISADFFSVLCDSSTDRSETEKEILYVRVMSDGYPIFLYLKMVDLES